MTKSFLDAHQVPYKDFNVVEDEAARDEMVSKTGGQMALPVILIGDDTLVGFNEKKLKEKLGLK